jgi:hypothetical protein
MLRRTLYLLHRSLVEPLRLRALRPLRARVLYPLRDRIIYRLDRFLGWPPYVQVGILLFIIVLFVSAFGVLYGRFIAPGEGVVDSLWWALTRFMDGGTMADDKGRLRRLLALGVTGSGVLILAFLTGTFASKMSERIEDLRSGRSPVVERRHVLVLGFDARVLFLARELARSHRRLKLVVLAAADKPRVEALLRRYLHQVPGARLRRLLARARADLAEPLLVHGDQAVDQRADLAAPRTPALLLGRGAGPGRPLRDASGLAGVMRRLGRFPAWMRVTLPLGVELLAHPPDLVALAHMKALIARNLRRVRGKRAWVRLQRVHRRPAAPAAWQAHAPVSPG